jgi:hypothetical protein
MNVWIYVEGDSDRLGLNALWAEWRQSLKKTGWGIHVIPLQGKPQFFRKIGPRAAEKLVYNQRDLVVGLPDLYPNAPFVNTSYKHDDLGELKAVQLSLVQKALRETFSAERTDAALKRFFPTAFKHDAEMLLLEARDQLREVLETQDALGNWRMPVEDQNQTKPPKHVVEDLFRTKKRKRYCDTIHMRAVLEKVSDIKTILYRDGLQCCVFKELMDWIGDKTGIPAY